MSDHEEHTITPSRQPEEVPAAECHGETAVAELREALAARQREAEASHDRYLRALADLDIARKHPCAGRNQRSREHAS